MKSVCEQLVESASLAQKLDPSLIIMQTIFVLDFYLTNTHQLEMFKI